MDQRDRETGEPLTSDFIFSKKAYCFIQDLPNGTYAVAVVIGDAIADQNGWMMKAQGEVPLVSSPIKPELSRK